ncbi:MAG: rhodanese-like domain-containing protein [Flavobacteriales bacterium]
MKNITQEQWRDAIASDQNAVIIDVRTPMEWDEGIIENAQLINIQNTVAFINEVKQLDSSKNYYLYCRSGARSQMACNLLESEGIKNTFNLLGGIMMWNGKLVQATK